MLTKSSAWLLLHRDLEVYSRTNKVEYLDYSLEMYLTYKTIGGKKINYQLEEYLK